VRMIGFPVNSLRSPTSWRMNRTPSRIVAFGRPWPRSSSRTAC